jgi:hypothetical protein
MLFWITFPFSALNECVFVEEQEQVDTIKRKIVKIISGNIVKNIFFETFIF